MGNVKVIITFLFMLSPHPHTPLSFQWWSRWIDELIRSSVKNILFIILFLLKTTKLFHIPLGHWIQKDNQIWLIQGMANFFWQEKIVLQILDNQNTPPFFWQLVLIFNVHYLFDWSFNFYKKIFFFCQGKRIR